jgi:hypothetical protein
MPEEQIRELAERGHIPAKEVDGAYRIAKGELDKYRDG